MTAIRAKNCHNLGQLYFKIFDDYTTAGAYYRDSVIKVEQLALTGSDFKTTRWHIETIKARQ